MTIRSKKAGEGFRIFFRGLIPDGKSAAIALVLILCFAFAIRLIGITWGLPEDHFTLSYYETETEAFEAIQSIDPYSGDMNPIRLRPLMINTLAGWAVLQAADTLGFCRYSRNITDYYDNPRDLRRCYLVLRIWNLITAVMGIWLIFGIGKFLGDDLAGLAAAGLCAIVTIHFTESHFFTHQLRFSTVLALVCYVALLALRYPAHRFGITAAVCIGLAMGTLNNGFFTLILIPYLSVAHFQRQRGFARALFSGRPFALAGIAVGIFILLLGPQAKLLVSLYEQFSPIWNKEVFYRYPETVGLAQIYLLTVPMALGLGGAVAVLFGLYNGWQNRRGPQGMLLILLIPFLAALPIFSVARGRYVLHILPMTMPLAGVAIVDLWQKLPPRRLFYGLFAALLLVVYGVTFSFTAAFFPLLTQKAQPLIASQWMMKHVPQEAKIGLVSEFRRGLPSIMEKGDQFPNRVSLEKQYDYSLPGDLDFLVTFDLELFGIYDKYLVSPKEFPKKSRLAANLTSGRDYRQVAVFVSQAPYYRFFLENRKCPLDLSFNLLPIRIFQNVHATTPVEP